MNTMHFEIKCGRCLDKFVGLCARFQSVLVLPHENRDGRSYARAYPEASRDAAELKQVLGRPGYCCPFEDYQKPDWVCIRGVNHVIR